MNLNNFTIKAQETIAKAQQIAYNNSNPNIENEHLLKALISDQESPVIFLLKKNNVNVPFVESKVDEAIGKLPTVQGTEPAQAVSRDLNNVILRTAGLLKTFGDEFVSVEHLLLAILQGKDVAANILKDGGLTEKNLVAAVKELRKGSTVNSQTASATFNALNKYARNLNEMARPRRTNMCRSSSRTSSKASTTTFSAPGMRPRRRWKRASRRSC
jgi:ATP-dependent Clp protease ATP-binding subunit ClpB